MTSVSSPSASVLSTSAENARQTRAEKRAEGKTAFILGFAVLFAYLFLVALYESWTIPVPVLLSVAVGVLGAFIGMIVTGLTLDLYAQIGMVVLIGAAAIQLYRNRFRILPVAQN